MTETQYPNRWFGSNPQAISSQGKKLTGFAREVPKNWRAALGADDATAAADDSAEATAPE